MSDSDRDGRPSVILVHQTSTAFSYFNPNDWTGQSKLIIGSCAAQLAVLQYVTSELETQFGNAESLYEPGIARLKEDWQTASWDVTAAHYYLDVPEIHVNIQAYLVTAKALLDFLAQLIETEGIVTARVHGFHAVNVGGVEIIGGKLLRILEGNVPKAKKKSAARLHQFIKRQKDIWIDEVVGLRNSLTHPDEGVLQTMFRLELHSDNGILRLGGVGVPAVCNKFFDEYAKSTLQSICSFISVYLGLVKSARPSATEETGITG